MNNNYSIFKKEFKTLIQKERNSNKTIYAKITNIDNKIIVLSSKTTTGLSKNLTVEVDRIKANILKINNKNITIELTKKANFKINQKVSIQNIQKDVIIKKLEEILDNIDDNKISSDNKETLTVLLENYSPKFSDENFNIPNLNNNQTLAVKRSLQSNKFHMIQGPPGTGKTYTIIEIIKQLYKMDKKILITTHTHIALDNILERLDGIDKEYIVRIGQKSKVSDSVKEYTLEEQIKLHPYYETILEKKRIIENLSNPQKVSEEKIIINKNDGFLNKIFNHIFQSNKNEIMINNSISNDDNDDNIERINEIKLEIDNIKNNIQNDILKNVKIVASTVISSSSFLTKYIDFDYMIMDEASQVPVYLSLIPLMKTNRFILIGDDKQLQPIQNENSSYFLNKSIFNLLINKYPNNYTFLNIQYRMNHEISDIASKLYYNSKLLTGDIVKNQKIEVKNESFLINNDPITVFDTSNIGFNESNTSNGCYNKYESKFILDIVKSLIKNNISEDEIGIITPYRKQKIYLMKLLRNSNINIECDTIYRFQGREKDVIIISFCKSLNKSLSKFQENFLADKNQLNVSITRSRKKLIIVANYSMLKSAKNIKKLFNNINRENIIYLEDLL